MELHLGKMTSREIAQWLGISYNTYKNNIKKYSSELDYYCDYQSIFGGVQISTIYIKTYIKNLTSKDSEVYLKLVKDSNSGVCSLAGMARKLAFLYPDTWGNMTQRNIEYRLNKVGIALFGKTNLPIHKQSEQKERYSGPYGYREYCWAIKVNNLNDYRFLTKEEDKIFDSLLKSYNINYKDVALKEQVEKELKLKLLNGDLTKEEYVIKSSKMDLFSELLFRFRDITGLTLVHATYHDILESGFDNREE